MLGPEDGIICEEGEKELADAREAVGKMNVVSTKDKTDKPGNGEEEMEVDHDATRVIFHLLLLGETTELRDSIVPFYHSDPRQSKVWSVGSSSKRRSMEGGRASNESLSSLLCGSAASDCPCPSRAGPQNY